MRPQRVTDEQIERAAAAAFIEQGPAASLASIATSLGITQPGLLHRVGSKETLLVRALCPGVPQALALLQSGPGAGALLEELETALTGLLAFLHEALPALSVLRFSGVDLAQVLPKGPPPPLAARLAIAEWLDRCGGRIECSIPAAVAGDLLVGSLEARAMNRHLAGRPVSAGEDRIYTRSLVAALIKEKQS